MKRTIEECDGTPRDPGPIKRKDVMEWCKKNKITLLEYWPFCGCSIVDVVVVVTGEEDGVEIGCKRCCYQCRACEKWYRSTSIEDPELCDSCLDEHYPETCKSCKERVFSVENGLCGDCHKHSSSSSSSSLQSSASSSLQSSAHSSESSPRSSSN